MSCAFLALCFQLNLSNQGYLFLFLSIVSLRVDMANPGQIPAGPVSEEHY